MFLHHLVEMGGFALNHHWRGINVLSVLECCLLAAVLFALLTVLFSFVRKSKRLRIASIVATMLFATAAYAANTALSALSASGALAGANLIYVVQTAGVGGVKATMTQVATFINSLFSGDFTVTSGGIATLKNTGPGATGPLGSTTTVPVVTIDAQGRVTALTSATAAGTVSSVATSCGATGGTITTSGTIKAAVTASSQTGANYTFQDSDCGKLINLSNASAQAPTLSAAGSGSLLFSSGGFVQVCNQGAGIQTLTPTTSTIGGAATYPLGAGSAKSPTCIAVVSDGTNYQVAPDALVGTVTGALKASAGGVISQAACADLSNGTALCSTTPGTGVATAAAANLSAAGGLTSTIASGTSALGTGAITSATCATVVTTTATNTATTDVIWWGFNGDPTGVTGYTPVTTGALTIFAYPSSGNVNFKACNLTTGSITPGAITLNWRVTR